MLYAINLPVVVSRWFSRKFGLAIAVVFAGWNIGGLVLAPITEYLIRAFGWREASMLLGMGLLIVALPPTAWFLRVPSAAAMGLPIDGELATDLRGGVPEPSVLEPASAGRVHYFPRWNAVRTR